MAAERGAYLGPRLRRLRRELGLSQPQMASDLRVSVSYVSLLESNQRPLTAEMLLRVARTYRIDVADFAGDGGAEFTSRLQATLKDPLFADIDISALQIADVATNYPGIAEALLRLYTAYLEEQRLLADMAAGGDKEDGGDTHAGAEVRRMLATHRNYFPSLDEGAEAIATEIKADGRLEEYLSKRHKLRVRPMPPHAMAGMIRRHDRHHAAIFLDDTLDHHARRFQLALQIAYLELNAEIGRIVEGTGLSSDNSRRLARRALGNYAAAAILMPYAAFVAAVDEKRYDVEALGRRFSAGFEQIAHRLTTLQKPGLERVPFFFVRIDAAGNVSKRLDGAGFPFAIQGGSCPLWTVHNAFRAPGTIVTQWLELPEGLRFFSIARTVTAGGGAFDAPKVERAIALVCRADQAAHLVYARAEQVKPSFTPVGITCSLCQRERCPARAVPPIGRLILPDDNHRSRAPYLFADV